jgi:hypothetical protein
MRQSCSSALKRVCFKSASIRVSQYWLEQRSHRRRARRDRCESHRFQRKLHQRHIAARWHAAKADGFVATVPNRLDAENPARGRGFARPIIGCRDAGTTEMTKRVRDDRAATSEEVPISWSETIRASDLALSSRSLEGANAADASPTLSLDIDVMGRLRVPGCARSRSEDRHVGRAIVRRPAVPVLGAA